MSKTIGELATEMQAQFTVNKRESGEEYIKLKDGAPQWMTDVCMAAHDSGSVLPDDHRYEFISDAIDKLAEVEHDGDAEDAADQLEADIYNNDLLKWVSSRLSRMSYCDDAIQDGAVTTLEGALSEGQLSERREVFSQVLDALKERQSELEDEEEDESDDSEEGE